MARITIEDCLENVPNRFALVLIAAERTKQLMRGSDTLVDDHRNNKEIVTSLREIAAKKVTYHERQVEERDPATEAMIRKATANRSGEPVAAQADSDFEDELEGAKLDNEFSDESELDRLFSKLDAAPADAPQEG